MRLPAVPPLAKSGIRSALLVASALAVAVAAAIGPNGDDGTLAFRSLLLGLALYVVARIFDRR